MNSGSPRFVMIGAPKDSSASDPYAIARVIGDHNKQATVHGAKLRETLSEKRKEGSKAAKAARLQRHNAEDYMKMVSGRLKELADSSKRFVTQLKSGNTEGDGAMLQAGSGWGGNGCDYGKLDDRRPQVTSTTRCEVVNVAEWLRNSPRHSTTNYTSTTETASNRRSTKFSVLNSSLNTSLNATSNSISLPQLSTSMGGVSARGRNASVMPPRRGTTTWSGILPSSSRKTSSGGGGGGGPPPPGNPSAPVVEDTIATAISFPTTASPRRESMSTLEMPVLMVSGDESISDPPGVGATQFMGVSAFDMSNRSNMGHFAQTTGAQMTVAQVGAPSAQPSPEDSFNGSVHNDVRSGTAVTGIFSNSASRRPSVDGSVFEGISTLSRHEPIPPQPPQMSRVSSPSHIGTISRHHIPHPPHSPASAHNGGSTLTPTSLASPTTRDTTVAPLSPTSGSSTASHALARREVQQAELDFLMLSYGSTHIQLKHLREWGPEQSCHAGKNRIKFFTLVGAAERLGVEELSFADFLMTATGSSQSQVRGAVAKYALQVGWAKDLNLTMANRVTGAYKQFTEDGTLQPNFDSFVKFHRSIKDDKIVSTDALFTIFDGADRDRDGLLSKPEYASLFRSTQAGRSSTTLLSTSM